MQQRVFLRSFESRWPRSRCFCWLRFAVATSVRQAPADTADQQKNDEDEDDDVENRPVTVRFRYSPVEEDVRHPEGVALATSRLKIAQTVT